MRWSSLATWLLVGTIGISSIACGGPQAASTPVVVVVTATPGGQSAASTPAGQAAAQPSPTAASKTGESLRPEGTPGAQGASAAGGTPAANTTTNPGGAVKAVGGKQEVTALWYRSDNTGGTTQVKITAEKNDQKEIRVGFFESEVGGSGAMWRAAGWMAVIMTNLLLGTEPNEYRYNFEAAGNIDGPSAGALFTVGTLAAVLGHPIKADAAMTGTINPDGTLGPVGGIPQKLDGAAAAKKKLVLIPAGQRQSIDMATQQSVDVVDRGRRLGVEVREVSDVYEAYELMTGRALPKPTGMREIRPELPGASFERTRAKAKEWFTRYWQQQSQYEAQPNDFKYDFTEALMADAAAAGDKADAYYQQGLPSAAYNRAYTATLYSSIALHTSKVIQTYVSSGLPAAISYLDSMRSVQLKLDAMVDRLETQNAATLSDVVAISDAYGNVILGRGLADLGQSALQREVATEEEVFVKLTEATLMFALAEHQVEVSKDSLDIGMGFGKAPAPSVEKVQALSEMFRRASEANISYFESVVLDGIAQRAGVHPAALKARFMSQDMSYTFAISSWSTMQKLRERAPGGAAGAYAILGGSMNSYVLSSVLVAKYYSLQAEVDDDGAITSVRHERAMINMLDFAERRSKEILGLANNVGAEPVAPVVAYEGAKVDREGDLDGKFSALQGFWMSALQGQAIGILSGRATVVTK